MRWALKLQPYSFEVQHRPGTQNGNADGLSRQAWLPDPEQEKKRPTHDFVAGGEGDSVVAR